MIGLTALAAFITWQRPFKYGLDVKGGIRLVYTMDTSRLTAEQRQDIDGVRSKIQTILTNRASGIGGVAEPYIAPKGDNQFIVELPDYTDLAAAKASIGTSARIEFYHATDVVTRLAPGRRYIPISDENSGDPVVKFQRAGSPTSPVIEPGTPEYERIIKGWDLLISGDELTSAQSQPAGSGYQPVMYFSPTGGQKMETWTRRFMNRGENIAAVLDGRVLSISPLADGAILRESAVIQGQFPSTYVNRLVDLLNAGSLPVDLKLESSEKVDPTIGKQALEKIVFAGGVAFIVIAIFMVGYYMFPGFLALIALAIYTLFTIAALKMIGASFSLAAIAGLILSIGMAVDANILVFERFKEEMKAGKSLNSAIQLGFKRALPAIVDSNACTILTSLVLSYFGSGPVKGFATTLIIGVLISLFTAVTVTRSFLMLVTSLPFGQNEKLYALGRNWFGERFETTADTQPLPVVGKWRKWFVISAITVIVGLPFIFMGGLKGNVEFRGGYSAQFNVADKQIDANQVTARLAQADITGTNVKFGGEGATRFLEITAPRDGALQGLPELEAIRKITDAAGFTAADLKGSSSVGPAIQAETIRNTILAVVISSGLIVLYLAFRFGFGLGGFGAGLRFGFSAIGALLHDVLVVVGVTAIAGYFAGWEVSALFITSMLTVIGFSVHDTIVIFDRIRENLHNPKPGETMENLINRSISQSFARSINTSMTVIASLLILLFIGTTTPDLKLFCVTMLAGILSGTYSSLYNASPILWLWDKAVVKKKGEDAGLIGLAKNDITRQVTGLQTAAVTAGVPISPTTPGAPGQAPTRTYSQVKRRASAVEKSKQDLDL